MDGQGSLAGENDAVKAEESDAVKLRENDANATLFQYICIAGG